MPVTESVPTTPATPDAEAQAKAKAALEQKMTELNQQPNWSAPVVTPAAPPAPQTQPVATTVVKPAPPQTPPVATKPVKPTPPVVQPAGTAPISPANANYPGKDLGLKPILAPPLPISPAKQAQLQGLFERYKADQITPEQYHAERARILAGP